LRDETRSGRPVSPVRRSEGDKPATTAHFPCPTSSRSDQPKGRPTAKHPHSRPVTQAFVFTGVPPSDRSHLTQLNQTFSTPDQAVGADPLVVPGGSSRLRVNG
jgi:hypothetical protein